jgi:hypothetical protein
MIKNQLFDLEKIKELTSPIEDLQARINQLDEIPLILAKNKKILDLNFPDDKILEIKAIFKIIENLNNNLISISKENVKAFFDFRDNLIENYKEDFKRNLMALKLQKEKTQIIGLYLIDNKKVSKVVTQISYILSIELPQWLELFESLKQNTIFAKTVVKLSKYYERIIQGKLRIELNNLPKDIDPLLRKQFESEFYENPGLKFETFLKNLENQLTHQDFKTKKEDIRRVREREEIEKLKKEQVEKKELYDDYLKLSQKEFERRRRKERRKALNRSKGTSKEIKDLELSDEVSEKIKKFKSKFDKSFEEKYLLTKDEESDPVDLIRKRKKKKEEEYKEFKDHFDNIE